MNRAFRACEYLLAVSVGILVGTPIGLAIAMWWL